MTTHPPPSESPGFDAITRLLAQRTDHLSRRDGLCDRVFARVELELQAPMVLASIGPAQWRRSLAIAAGLLLACGVVATLVLNNNTETTRSPVRSEALVVADGSHAERMLIALIEPASDVRSGDRAAIIDEILPSSSVQLDELDREMRALLGQATDVGGDTAR